MLKPTEMTAVRNWYGQLECQNVEVVGIMIRKVTKKAENPFYKLN